MESKKKIAWCPQDSKKKHSGRFRPINYLTTYTNDIHTRFKERITLLYTMVDCYHKHRNIVRWAKCCFCIEGKATRGSLNHPEEEMITLKDLVVQEQIENEADLFAYMKKTLPRNSEGDILLPQINMKHSTTMLARSEVDVLREKLAKVEAENRLLKATVEEMKQRADADSKSFLSLNENLYKLHEKLDTVERDKWSSH